MRTTIKKASIITLFILMIVSSILSLNVFAEDKSLKSPSLEKWVENDFQFKTDDSDGKVVVKGLTDEGVKKLEKTGGALEILDKFQKIDASAFRGLGITSVTIPNSVTTIGSEAFTDNKLTSIDIPNSVTTIDSDAFVNNKLTSVDIPNSVTTIGDRAFAVNRLLFINVPDSATNIGDKIAGYQASEYFPEKSSFNFKNFGYNKNFIINDNKFSVVTKDESVEWDSLKDGGLVKDKDGNYSFKDGVSRIIIRYHSENNQMEGHMFINNPFTLITHKNKAKGLHRWIADEHFDTNKKEVRKVKVDKDFEFWDGEKFVNLFEAEGIPKDSTKKYETYIRVVGTKGYAKSVTDDVYDIIYKADDTKELGYEHKVKGHGRTSSVWGEYKLGLIENSEVNAVKDEEKSGSRYIPAQDTVITKGTKSKIVTEKIMPKKVYQADESKKAGEKEVTKKGVKGTKTTTTSYILNEKTGKITSKATEKIKDVIDEVVSVGTKPEVKRIVKDGKVIEVTTTYTLNEETGEVTPKVTEKVVSKKKVNNNKEVTSSKDNVANNSVVKDAPKTGDKTKIFTILGILLIGAITLAAMSSRYKK